MIVPDLPEVLAIAATVLERDAEWVCKHCDLEPLAEALNEATKAAEMDDPALTAATLLSGLVTTRPFPNANRRVAVTVTLHLLARAGWDLELEPVKEFDQVLDRAGDITGTALRLRARMRPLTGSRDQADMRGPHAHGTDMDHTDTDYTGSDYTDTEKNAMFERFTDRARRVVVLAQEEARDLNHHYIGTEHLLLGLIHEGSGIAAKALENLGVELAAARTKVENIIGRGEQAPGGHIPFTPRGKRALELAMRESKELGNGSFIGTEHILLGLIREGEGVAAEALAALGVDLSQARAAVLEVLRRHRPDDERASQGWAPSAPGGTSSSRRQVIQDELDAVFAENERLRADVDRLRALLRLHGIDPDESAA